MSRFGESDNNAPVLMSFLLAMLAPFWCLMSDQIYWRFIFWLLVLAVTVFFTGRMVRSNFRAWETAFAAGFFVLSILFFYNWKMLDYMPYAYYSCLEEIHFWIYKFNQMRRQ